MAWIYFGGAEEGVSPYDTLLGIANNPLNPTTALGIRGRQFSFAFPIRNFLNRTLGVSVWQDATELLGAYIRADGTIIIFYGAFPGITIATGIVGAIVAGQYYDAVLSGFLDNAAGSASVLLDGVVAASAAGVRTVPATETYFNRRRIICNYDGLSPAISTTPALLRKMTNAARHGSFAYRIAFDNSSIDDDCMAVPSLLCSTVVGAPAAGALVTGFVSGATMRVSDFDSTSLLQAAAGARIWGYSQTGVFQNGEVLTAAGFTAIEVAPAAALASGLEPPALPLANWFVFPDPPVSDTATPRGLTLVGALPTSWQAAAQTPPNPATYLENSTNVSGSDEFNNSGDIQPTDVIGGVCLYFNARRTDASITQIQGTYTDTAGVNTTTSQNLPTDWAELTGDPWGMRSDGTALDPTDLAPSAVTSAILAP